MVVLSGVTAVILCLYVGLRSPSPRADLVKYNIKYADDSIAPLRRIFAADLAVELRQALAHDGIRHLLVLAAEADQQLKINWRGLAVDVRFASTVDQLLLLLDSPPYSTCASACAAGAASRGVWHRDMAAAAAAAGRDSSQVTVQDANQEAGSSQSSSSSQSSFGHDIPAGEAAACTASVALLVKARDGALPLRHIWLMKAAMGKLQQCLAFTAAFGTYQDKGDSLIVLGRDGEPVSAAFKPTNVFRDKFSGGWHSSKCWTFAGKMWVIVGRRSQCALTTFVAPLLPSSWQVQLKQQ
jgi:hypothetical protein